MTGPGQEPDIRSRYTEPKIRGSVEYDPARAFAVYLQICNSRGEWIGCAVAADNLAFVLS